MRPLDPLTFPLTGSRLIEASAGTGKTYTIANLYLRLVLERGLEVTEILVVTFTKAATEELRDRIRRRLREGLERLEAGTSEGDELDELLTRGGEAAVQRLRDALIRMDEAAVFTIHGFCQRMLQENAFESGTLFDVEFIADELEMKRTIAADFWRIRFHQADEAEARWARSEWGTPEGLFQALQPLLGREQVTLLPTVTEGQLEEALASRATAFEGVRTTWGAHAPAVTELLLTHKGLSRAATTYRNDMVEAALEELATFLDDGGPMPASFELFTSHRLGDPKSLKKGATAPEHPLFDACEALWQAESRFGNLRRARLLAEALAYTRAELLARKEQQRVLAYDDLLSRLDFALMGEGGETLAARVARLFPAAMIDEFQDTDPLQYRIFRRVYGEREECGLFMIGDPKQAIYGFRGADIFTYMAARRDADPAEGCFTLETNWRSASPLVEAVNGLFQSTDAPFLYRDEIDFHPVKAAGRADEAPLTLDDQTPSPLAAWLIERDDDKPLPKSKVKPLFAEATAAEIVRLLKLAEAGRARLEGRALRAGDLAVLVRDRYEAAEVRAQLAAAGVGSVYISRDSVFQSAEAEELLRLTVAVAEPTNGRALRAALVTTLLGVDGVTLAAMVDEAEHHTGRWEGWLEAFHRYHRLWRDHGFMAMFQSLLHERGVAHRLLALEEGERRLTNLLQLAELAQLAAEERFGMEGVIHWLEEQIDHPDGDAEEQQLRLESDERLVQVVTIHKSKGLEYPVVFLPGLWDGRPLDDKGQLLLFHEEEGRSLCADLGSDRRDTHLALAQSERLAEELRLLYVALTRAKYRCCFGWGAVKGAEATALAWLLHGGEGMTGLDDAALRGALERLGGLIEVTAPPTLEGVVATAGRALPAGGARPFIGAIEDRWLVTSYSGLVAGIEGHDTLRHERPDHDAVEPAEAAAGPRRDRFSFPRGARAGLFLHTLLEQLDFTAERDAERADFIEHQLERHGFEVEWRPAIEELLGGILDTPLADGVALGRIQRPDRRDELAFHFPLAPIEASGLNRLLDRFPGYFSEERALTFTPLEGMMKGFIDLVFRVDGRYYLTDYKSNHLGDALDDYGPEALRGAMAEHRYDLQYLIYTVALHRHLRRSLPDYDYGRHFGGVFYLFLRGLSPRRPGNGVWFDRPDPALVEALDRYFSEGRP